MFARASLQKSVPAVVICTFAHFAYRHNVVQMHRFDPTWQQHRLHLGPTSANKALTSAQLGSKMAQLGP